VTVPNGRDNCIRDAISGYKRRIQTLRSAIDVDEQRHHPAAALVARKEGGAK
jgi:hypothetical protein